MARFLLPTTPLYGHLSPMLSVGRSLVGRGHEVTVLTGRKHRGAVESRGLEFLALPAEVDYDDADLDAWLPGRSGRSGLAAGRHDVIGLFVRPLVVQHRALVEALEVAELEERPYDAVVAEAAYLGALPLVLATGPDERIPVVGVSVTPLAVPSVDCAPFGSGLDPGSTRGTRRRNRLLNAVLRRGPLRPIQREMDVALRASGLPRGAVGYFDHVLAFDETFHLAVPGIEYPRRELPASVRLVGPVRPDLGRVALPDWWDDLDEVRPVVHVTQGTMDNADLGRLAVPAVEALADEDVWVVVSTGGRPVEDLAAGLGRPLPSNVRVAPFLPYGALLPRTDVMITNGGFGGVQQALAYGVPLVVAGATEDKPEVAARVRWAGAGIDLRTGTPTAAQVLAAVRTVLAEPRYRSAVHPPAARDRRPRRPHGHHPRHPRAPGRPPSSHQSQVSHVHVGNRHLTHQITWVK